MSIRIDREHVLLELEHVLLELERVVPEFSSAWRIYEPSFT